MSQIDELDARSIAALEDLACMPEVLAESQRLMHDADAEVRTRAAAIAWFAIRRVIWMASPAERVLLCTAVAVDLEAAFAAGLVGQRTMLANVLRGLLKNVIQRGGEISEGDY